MLYYEKGWFTERSRVYKEISERDDLFKKMDSTFFYFNSPEAGWIDIEMYLNGKKLLTCACSCVYDPFPDMIRWLEDIVRSNNMETTMRIDTEGEEMYLHYEKLRDWEFWVSTKNNWRSCSKHQYSELGLFSSMIRLLIASRSMLCVRHGILSIQFIYPFWLYAAIAITLILAILPTNGIMMKTISKVGQN